MIKHKTLWLILLSCVVLLSGCGINMTYYPSLKSDDHTLYYTLEYDFYPESLAKLDTSIKVPFPMLDSELLTYVTKVSANLPYYKDEQQATYPELPYFYDLKKLKSDAKYQKVQSLTVTYQIDARKINTLPETLQIEPQDLPNQVKTYLKLSSSDEPVSALATTLREKLLPQDQQNLSKINALFEGWIWEKMKRPVHVTDYTAIVNNRHNMTLLLQNLVGSQEDIAQLLVVMYRSQGVPARILTGLDGAMIERKSDPRKPADLKLLEDSYHVQVEIYSGGRWHLLEPNLYPTLKSNVTNFALPSGKSLSVYKSDSTYKPKPLMPMGYLSLYSGERQLSEPLLGVLNSSTPSSVYLD